MTPNRRQTILLVSDDAAFCAAARQKLEANQREVRVAAVSTVDAARRIVVDAAPAVILLEHTSIPTEAGAMRGGSLEHSSPLESVVSDLAASAPVVVIAGPTQEMELSALVAAGFADFVPREAGCLPAALSLVEQRLREAGRTSADATQEAPMPDASVEGFGEVLRHELNNPLTGILGNAELLLAEVRRKNDGKLPNGGQQRLETIAALAVRLRETVRRLSQDWESRNVSAAQRTVPAGVPHHSSAR
jgi:signal transduction histidine kinase